MPLLWFGGALACMQSQKTTASGGTGVVKTALPVSLVTICRASATFSSILRRSTPSFTLAMDVPFVSEPLCSKAAHRLRFLTGTPPEIICWGAVKKIATHYFAIPSHEDIWSISGQGVLVKGSGAENM